jgi:hypothetical protein
LFRDSADKKNKKITLKTDPLVMAKIAEEERQSLEDQWWFSNMSTKPPLRAIKFIIIRQCLKKNKPFMFDKILLSIHVTPS